MTTVKKTIPQHHHHQHGGTKWTTTTAIMTIRKRSVNITLLKMTLGLFVVMILGISLWNLRRRWSITTTYDFLVASRPEHISTNAVRLRRNVTSSSSSSARVPSSSSVQLPSITTILQKEDDNNDNNDKLLLLLLPHVVYDNLKYRRVCAKSYDDESMMLLCMILRYPFEVPLQNPNVTYPSPVDERFYNLTKAILLDDDDDNDGVLEGCRRRRQSNNGKKESLSASVYHCLENEAQRRRANNDTIVLALFTRISSSSNDDNDGDFYGTKSPLQKQRLHDYYRDHDIVVVGDSLAPFVTHALAKQLHDSNDDDTAAAAAADAVRSTTISTTTTCRQLSEEELVVATRGLKRKIFYNCSSSFNNNNNNNSSSLTSSSSSSVITLQNMWYRPASVTFNAKWAAKIRSMNGTKPFIQQFRIMTALLRPLLSNTTSTTTSTTTTTTTPTTISSNNHNNNEQQQIHLRRRRPLAIILSYPIAWTQSHGMIVHDYPHVEYNQHMMIQMMMNVTTPEVQQELHDMGFDLTSVVALDGFPQHFPSDTGAYSLLYNNNNRDGAGRSLHNNNSPEHYNTCRGPLPPSSALKRINEMDRKLFLQYGMDPKYYANTWEFTNQFWWEKIRRQDDTSSGGVLDCVHPRSKDAATAQVVMFFLQNMIDGYYESQQQQQQQQQT